MSDRAKRTIEEIFGAAYGMGQPSTVGDVAKLVRDYEARIAAIKAKSRTLIDVAWNKAIDAAVVEVGNALANGEDVGRALNRIKRKVRK